MLRRRPLASFRLHNGPVAVGCAVELDAPPVERGDEARILGVGVAALLEHPIDDGVAQLSVLEVLRRLLLLARHDTGFRRPPRHTQTVPDGRREQVDATLREACIDLGDLLRDPRVNASLAVVLVAPRRDLVAADLEALRMALPRRLELVERDLLQPGLLGHWPSASSDGSMRRILHGGRHRSVTASGTPLAAGRASPRQE